MWYALSGSEWYKTEAFENFNWATYCTSSSGFVSVGPEWLAAWFSDGYGDYIKHFLDGMAAIPEWAPTGDNHWLGSTGIVQTINYGTKKLSYRTFQSSSTEVLRLTRLPKQILVDGITLQRDDHLTGENCWSWKKLKTGGVLRIKRTQGRTVEIINP
jgi:hypothetical protein